MNQRAARSVRATDENAPQALSGYRPKVALTASAGVQYTDVNTTAGGSRTALVRTEVHGVNAPRSAGLTALVKDCGCCSKACCFQPLT
jgi:outer membrane protein